MESNKWIVSTNPADRYKQKMGWACVATLVLILASCGNKSRIEQLRLEHRQQYEAQLLAQQDTLHMADSMLTAITPTINSFIAQHQFIFDKSAYDELGRFFIKGTDTESRVGNTYLHATANEYGITQLISEYRGSKYINHTQIRLTGTDGSQCLTQVVPLELTGSNYHFQNQGIFHESVTFTADEALAYIATHRTDNRISVELLADSKTLGNYILQHNEIESLANTYDLSLLLAQQLHATQLSRIASDKIRLLQMRLDDNTPDSK